MSVLSYVTGEEINGLIKEEIMTVVVKAIVGRNWQQRGGVTNLF